jgi:hypothetical protein
MGGYIPEARPTYLDEGFGKQNAMLLQVTGKG